tara:strand:+ start:16106 stop:16627 length:522 start_codon:yes stop_codon:yes gene_type:complete
VVESQLSELKIPVARVSLGEVDFDETVLTDEQLTLFKQKIESFGFELIGDKRSRLIETIKRLIIELVQKQDGLRELKLSDYLTRNIAYEYSYLSTLFSSVEGITVEKYCINQKIERVKELLVYDELSLTEISFQLGYSSLAHLSTQFKSVTGLSPSHFKNMKNTTLRNSIDKI